MGDQLSCAKEQLGKAVHTLATTEGLLKDRLLSASLYVAAVPLDGLPDILKTCLIDLQKKISPRQRLEEMSDKELYWCADDLVALAFMVRAFSAKE